MGASARLGEVDRYLVPVGKPRVLDYFLNRLFVAHGTRERVLRRALFSPVRRPVRPLLFHRTWRAGPDGIRPEGEAARMEELKPWREAGELLRELDEAPDVLKAAGIPPLHPGQFILLRDYDANSRGRLLLFPFRPGAPEPVAVVKLRDPSAAGPSLRVEVEALRRIRARPELADSVPELLAFRRSETAEILVLSNLPGRSAYVTMQTSLRPWRFLRDHFRAAAEWLATFHNAFRRDGSERSAVHGDFWARNLLLRPLPRGGTGVAVVDWEHFCESGSPLQDVLHFPLTYGLNYPWRRYRRLPRLDAFRRTFIEPTPVSEQVASYFARYCALTGLDPDQLRPALIAHLHARAEKDGSKGGAWLACGAALGSALGGVLRT